MKDVPFFLALLTAFLNSTAGLKIVSLDPGVMILYFDHIILTEYFSGMYYPSASGSPLALR